MKTKIKWGMTRNLTRLAGAGSRVQELAARLEYRALKRLHRDLPSASDARPVFVLSTGRTGTLTLAKLMALNPRVDAYHEPEPRLVETSFLSYMDTCGVDPSFWEETLRRCRGGRVQIAAARGRTYFESNNRLTYMAPHLLRVFPHAKFLYVTRAPSDFIRSGVRRNFYGGHRWDHARLRPRPSDEIFDRWESLSPSEKCAWLWLETNRYCLDFISTLGRERVLSFQCEQLFRADLTLIKDLFAFVADDAPPSDASIRRVLGKQLNRQPPVGDPSIDGLDMVRDVSAQLGYPHTERTTVKR